MCVTHLFDWKFIALGDFLIQLFDTGKSADQSGGTSVGELTVEHQLIAMINRWGAGFGRGAGRFCDRARYRWFAVVVVVHLCQRLTVLTIWSRRGFGFLGEQRHFEHERCI